MHMLKFDLGGRTLSVIVDTPGMYGAIPMMAEDGGLGFVGVLDDSIYSWSWQAGTHGNSASWVRQWMMDLMPLVPNCHRKTMREVIGLVEGTQTIFIYSPRVGIFTLDLNSRQVKKLGRGGFYYNIYFSFVSTLSCEGRTITIHHLEDAMIHPTTEAYNCWLLVEMDGGGRILLSPYYRNHEDMFDVAVAGCSRQQW
ncbi:hypothetical protein EJB05_14216, partial [Eragrostis curvula]